MNYGRKASRDIETVEFVTDERSPIGGFVLLFALIAVAVVLFAVVIPALS